MSLRSLPFKLDENPSYLSPGFVGNTWTDPGTGDKYRVCYTASAITSSVGTKWAALSSTNNTTVEVSTGAEALTAGVFASGLTTLTASSYFWVQTDGVCPISCSTTGSIAAKALIGSTTGGQAVALAATGSNVSLTQAHALAAAGTAASTVTCKLRGLD